jgi:hypothetical protein
VTTKQKHIVERTHIQVCSPFLPFWLEGRTLSHLFESLVTSFLDTCYTLYMEKKKRKSACLQLLVDIQKLQFKGAKLKSRYMLIG